MTDPRDFCPSPLREMLQQYCDGERGMPSYDELAALLNARTPLHIFGAANPEQNEQLARDAQSIVDADVAALAMAVPDGWKLVPFEPTREMLEAWVSASFESRAKMTAREVREGRAKKEWQAMLNVAPAAPAAEGDVKELTDDEIEALMHKGGLIGVAGDNPLLESKLIGFARAAIAAKAAS